MAELADAQDSGSCPRKGVEVRLLSPALLLRNGLRQIDVSRFFVRERVRTALCADNPCKYGADKTSVVGRFQPPFLRI